MHRVRRCCLPVRHARSGAVRHCRRRVRPTAAAIWPRPRTRPASTAGTVAAPIRRTMQNWCAGSGADRSGLPPWLCRADCLPSSRSGWSPAGTTVSGRARCATAAPPAGRWQRRQTRPRRGSRATGNRWHTAAALLPRIGRRITMRPMAPARRRQGFFRHSTIGHRGTAQRRRRRCRPAATARQRPALRRHLRARQGSTSGDGLIPA